MSGTHPRVVSLRAEELIRLRHERGWTQEILAHKAGYDVRTVQRAERSGRAVVTTVAGFALALGCNVTDLLVKQISPAGGQEDTLNVLQEYVVFPQARPPSQLSGYPGSWLGSGENDFVVANNYSAPLEGAIRRSIPVYEDDEPLLCFAFDHRLGVDPKESWWAGAIPVALPGGVKPPTVAVTPFRTLCIEARVSVSALDERMERPIPLLVRLEEGLQGGPVEGRRTSCPSSSWGRRPLSLTDSFHQHRCDLLREFDWSKNAWHENSAAPNRRAIGQIIVGQDSAIENCSATIEVRRVWFTRD
jgi:transcriptional regulator with XRE-family HTH domain